MAVAGNRRCYHHLIVRSLAAIAFMLATCGWEIGYAQEYEENPRLGEFKPRSIDDPQLARILALSDIIELDHLPSYQTVERKTLGLRLFAVPGDNYWCVPETDAYSCNAHYFLAVASSGVIPEAAAYDLGQYGEVVATDWLEPHTSEDARLGIEVRRYPQAVVEVNPDLLPEQKTRRYVITVSLESIQVERVD